MFLPITIPYDAKMLFNVVRLKPEYTVDDAELAMGEMCNVVKETYRDDGGFIAGQVFKAAGFVSKEGSIGKPLSTGEVDNYPGEQVGCLSDDHLVIITYWKSFDQHETSHADTVFKAKFAALAEMCIDTFEIGYEMLWQGEPE